ncbi:Hsp20/alpha crystallin family protein [Marinithermus hydrothermalis]|uniref:Heat shock protein Hsp20 n=1 Tax=Marinithermus hydrothermalis (strain DSM 14884 / JCM 11576 / T1) TaxID=869210 RepID=F2NLU0_MARHT|nr:Hsp20/alpha crystallin family protein [Marinithermus hydrothermalis]AEB10920.1 heat shock protein Hsp20 [Marinithermus hydrothermalis DSM 14884]
MLERFWPFKKGRFRRAIEGVLERVWSEGLESLEPKAELLEEEGRYRLRLEVPGLGKNDLKVYLEGDYLVVEGERKEERRTRRYSEIHYGRIYRAFPLPPDARREGLKARLRRGVLEVSIPREALPRHEVELEEIDLE